jgi:hypothetical protein
VKEGFAIVSYVQFKERRGGPYLPYAFQNYYINEKKIFQEIEYSFAPLGVSGGGGRQAGEKSRGAIVAPASSLTQNIFWEADRNHWLVRVISVEVDTSDDQELGVISDLFWSCKVEGQVELGKPGQSILQLSSPLDSVKSLVGGRPLSQNLVGALPSSGSISV